MTQGPWPVLTRTTDGAADEDLQPATPGDSEYSLSYQNKSNDLSVEHRSELLTHDDSCLKWTSDS